MEHIIISLLFYFTFKYQFISFLLETWSKYLYFLFLI